MEEGKCDTICIVPLDKNISSKFLGQIAKMCKAFFFGCKVKTLPRYDIDMIDKVEKRVLSLTSCIPLDIGTFPKPDEQSEVV